MMRRERGLIVARRLAFERRRPLLDPWILIKALLSQRRWLS
jgi:hypothetical protein